MKHILRLVNYCKTLLLKHNQHFTLTFRSLSETFIRRSLFNSSFGSCHDSNATWWQEIGRRTAIFEPGRGELHAEPHVRPISCHVASLSWQEPEVELNKLLLMKVSDRDRKVKVKCWLCWSNSIFVPVTCTLIIEKGKFPRKHFCAVTDVSHQNGENSAKVGVSQVCALSGFYL